MSVIDLAKSQSSELLLAAIYLEEVMVRNRFAVDFGLPPVRIALRLQGVGCHRENRTPVFSLQDSPSLKRPEDVCGNANNM